MWGLALGSLLVLGARADVPADLVDHIPGFNATDFKVYSGYLSVPGPLNGYDSLSIHYQFHLAQTDPQGSPVAAWHQGGPGGSSTQGGMIEMGYFQVADDIKVNPHAWNRVANMLYLESPAGSGQQSGFSQCIKKGTPVTCSWNDVTQAEAYGHTLLSFFKAFPEFAENDLYLAGESYFGQYGPNIAHSLLNNDDFSSINLQGLLVGNGCIGMTNCNGPNAQRNDADTLYGKGLVSKKQYKKVYEACGYGAAEQDQEKLKGVQCVLARRELNQEVGPYNVYDIFDNCPKVSEHLERTDEDMGQLIEQARTSLMPGAENPVREGLLGASGGYSWECGGTYPPGKVADFVTRADVRKALHLGEPGQSGFRYLPAVPASPSLALYPELAKRIRVLIYNGDADMCVPYVGNEEWIGGLEEQGLLEQAEPWRPWFTDAAQSAPAGSKITYNVANSSQVFTFLTIRLAGHMVPLFRPEAASAFFSDFIKDGEKAKMVSLV